MDHGAVDKSSSEQKIHDTEHYTSVVRDIWAHAPSVTRSYSRLQLAGMNCYQIQRNNF